MADYYLKDAATPTRMYRLNYEASGDPLVVTISGAFVTGLNVRLPDGQVVSGVDVPVDLRPILTEAVLDTVVPGTVAEYRTLAQAVIATQWT